MTRGIAAALALACTVAWAEPPADAPLTFEVKEGTLYDVTGGFHVVRGGTYQNETAAKNTASYIREMELDREKRDGRDAAAVEEGGPPVELVVIAALLGFALGTAAGKLLN